MVSLGKVLNPLLNAAGVNPDGSGNTNTFGVNGLNENSNPNSGNKLPSARIRSDRENATTVRKIIHWLVPEIGIVEMYINPNNIQYSENKMLSKTKTKNGFNVQYLGEELETLGITGTTGSSGVEGINVLREVYRAEQLAFDPMAVQLYSANDDFENALGDLLGGGALGAIGAGIGSALFGQGSTGLAGGVNANVPTLASIAFGVEMYYDGEVRHGYFESFSCTESADNFLWSYNMKFVVTQKRGYRGNYFPFHRSANKGPSNKVFDGSGYDILGTPLTFR